MGNRNRSPSLRALEHSQGPQLSDQLSRADTGRSYLLHSTATFVRFLDRGCRPSPTGRSKSLSLVGTELSTYTLCTKDMVIMVVWLYWHKSADSSGPFVRISPTEIAIADIEAWRQIHRVGSDFRKNPKWYQAQAPSQYDDNTCGVFGLNDPKKASARRQLFLRAGTRKIAAEWDPQIKQLVDLTVEKIKRDLRTGQCDVMKWWTLMTADVVGDLAFGESFNNVKNEKVHSCRR